jgi:hypothetical protein
MDRARRLLVRSVPSLWLMGVCVFLPMVRACEKLESPASLIRGEPLPFAAMLSPLVVAELIAILLIVMLARGYVSRALSRLAFALVLAASSSSLALTAPFLLARHADEQLWGLYAAACFVAAATLLWRARRLDGWQWPARLVGVFAVLTLPVATLLARIIVEDGPHKVGVGAWLFLAAEATLLALHARWRPPPPVASSPG